jgi:anti-sigma factor RsiW
MKWFRNPCAERRESLSLLASGVLPEPEAAALKTHLAECNECRLYFNDLNATIAPLAGWEKHFSQIEPNPATQQRWFQELGRDRSPSGPVASARRPYHRNAAGTEGCSTTGNWLLKLWLELVWPCRRTWAGLSAVWAALIVFHAAQSGTQETTLAAATMPTPETRVAFREQQRLLVEILGALPVETPAEPAPRGSPPRSRLRSRFSYA